MGRTEIIETHNYSIIQQVHILSKAPMLASVLGSDVHGAEPWALSSGCSGQRGSRQQGTNAIPGGAQAEGFSVGAGDTEQEQGQQQPGLVIPALPTSANGKPSGSRYTLPSPHGPLCRKAPGSGRCSPLSPRGGQIPGEQWGGEGRGQAAWGGAQPATVSWGRGGDYTVSRGVLLNTLKAGDSS